MDPRKTGAILVAVSAISFGALPIFARKASAAGLETTSLLFLRFLMAAALLWGLVALRRTPLPRGRDLAILIGMGAIGYVGQSFTYFSAIERIDASLASLLLYLYPLIVTVIAVLFLNEKMTRPKAIALALALVGTGLTIGRVEGGNTTGILFGIGSAVFYGLYIVVGSRVMSRVDPLAATTLVITCAMLVYAVMSLVRGQTWPPGIEPYAWTAALAVFCTVVAIGTFLAGLDRVGPVVASSLSTLEPAITAVLSVLFLGESFTALKLFGGALILVSVLILARSRD